MTKYGLIPYLTLAFLISMSCFQLHAQSQINPVTNSIELFNTANILHERHHYNPDFIRMYGVKSIQLHSETSDEETGSTFFTQYDFTPSGQIDAKAYYKKTGDEFRMLTQKKYLYNGDGKLLEVEDYYEDILELVTHYVYVGDLLEKIYEESPDGPTGNRSEHDYQGRRLFRKVTHQKNQVKYVEYHLPKATLPARLDTLYSRELQESLSKNVYFYLYEDGQIQRTVWYTPKGKKDINYDYTRGGKLLNIKQNKKKGTTIGYKYEKGNLKQIKENRHKQPSIQHHYTYDEADVFVMYSEVKRGSEILESQTYKYEFWEAALEEEEAEGERY